MIMLEQEMIAEEDHDHDGVITKGRRSRRYK